MTGLARFLICAAGPLLVSSPVLAQQTQGHTHGPFMWNGGWHGWFFGPIMMIVFIAVAVVVVVLLVRWLGGPSHGIPHHQPPTNTSLR